MSIELIAVGAASEKLGWQRRTLEVEHTTVRDLLKSLTTVDGGTLYDVVAEGEELKHGYLIAVDGVNIKTRHGLNTEVAGGTTLTVVEIATIPAGG